MRFITPRRLVLVLLLAGCDASEELNEARALAQTGQVDLAVSKLEALIAEDPELRDAYVALGDVRFQAGAASKDQGTDAARDLFTKAATAYDGALKVGTQDEGLLRVKQSVSLALGGDREAGKQALDAAWSCCRVSAALPLLEPDQVAEALTGWEGTLGAWTTHPTYAAYPPEERTRFVVRPDGVELLPLDSDEPAAALPAFWTGKLEIEVKDGRAQVAKVGEYGKYVDQQHPEYLTESGWVSQYACGASTRNGYACVSGPLASQGGSPAVYQRAFKGHEARRTPKVSLAGVNTSSIRCGSGKPTSHACPVTFKRKRLLTRRVSLDALWLVPALGVEAPDDALQWSHEAGLTEVRDHLAQGEIATGLPEPLVRWAIGTVKPTFEVTPSSVVMHFDGPQGTFTVENGLLSGFEFKPFDRDMAEVDEALKHSGDAPAR